MDPTTTTTTTTNGSAAVGLPSSSSSSSSSSGPTDADLQTAFEHSIWYLLDLWTAMRVAVANQWGGAASADKRDQLAAEIAALWARDPQTDAGDVEFVLLDYMGSEFDCEVDDRSEVEVAREILLVRQRLRDERSLAASREVEERWRNRGAMKAGPVRVQEVNQDAEEGAVVDDDDDDDDEDEDEDDDGDVDMDAPPLVPVVPRERPAPIVDEDGFTKVVGKKRR